MDSYSGQANDPLSLNLYTYCKNNPVYYIDPSGHNSLVANPNLWEGIWEALVGTGTKAVSTVKKASPVIFGLWLFDTCSIDAGGHLTQEQLDYIANVSMVEKKSEPTIFPREESDKPYIIIDFEQRDKSFWSEGISIFEKDYYIYTSQMEREESIRILFAKDIPNKYPWNELPMSGDHPFNPPLDKAGNPIMKKGPNKGLLDANGNEWIVDKPATKVGNFHWDVQHKNGTHTNVNPQSNNPGSINHGENNF